MDHLFASIDVWWIRHPFEAALTSTPLISLFGAVVRQAVLSPLRYASTGLLRTTRKRAARDLQIMELVGNNPFMLIAYLGYSFIHELFWTCGLSLLPFLLIVCVSVSSHGSFPPISRSLVLFSINFGGLFVVSLIRLYNMLGNFLSREKAMEQLQSIVAGHPGSKEQSSPLPYGGARK